MALTELQLLFRRCLHRRMSANEFLEILKQYRLKQNVKSRELVSTYINCLSFGIEGDPLLAAYLQVLLASRSASLIDFVTALLVQWKTIKDTDQQRVVSLQTRVVTDLNIILATTPSLIIDQYRKCVILTARWLTAMVKWSMTDQLKESVVVQNLTQLLGVQLISQLNFNTMSNAPDVYEAVQQALDQCMGTFPSVSMELMNRLGAIQKPAQDDPSDVEPHVMEMAALQFEDGVINAVIVPTRSATVALLQHALCTASTIDDSVIYAFLNARFAGNHAAMFNDVVFASIEALLKPLTSQLYQDQCLLFILNKLPFILAFIVTSSFESFSSEQNLVDAWNYVIAANPDLAPRRFLQICSFHHLISTESVTALTGEDSTLKGLYAKDDLVAQVTANHTRGPRLIDELLKNDGNAGMISQAIYEVMNNYCHMRETQHLKDMANAIVREPAAINAIAMFIKPAVFLPSFCTLLDQWKWDDIHGESQPVYDEFGSVFLLVLAFKQRLRLTDSELGIQQKGFLARYLGCKNTEAKLNETTQKHLGDWIKSLYIDEGLSDELTTSCSAQEFYLLVPTLLRQSTTAHLKGKLSQETLKAGLEYLLEPFLLPSLLPAFGWIGNIALTEPKTAQLVMQILVNPSGNEAREIYQTILAIGADQLHMDLLPKVEFAIDLPQGDMTQIATESFVSLEGIVNTYGPLQVVHMLLTLSLQGDFASLLDFVATMIVVSNLQSAVQAVHSKLGHYLKAGDNLYAEAVVHLSRRVELYTTTLITQDLGMEPFVPMNVANVNLDAVPEAFQQQEQNQDIDQVLNEAAAMGMDQLDTSNLDDMYELQADDFGLGNLGDLDLDMF